VTVISYIFIGIIVAVAFIKFNPNKEKPATTEIYSMNTIIDITVYGPDKEKAEEEIIKEIHKINNLVDDFSKNSDVYKINENAGIKPVQVDPLTIDMISKSVGVAEETQGAFDPTIYPLSKIWGFKSGDFRIPKKEEIQAKLTLVSYKNIKVDKNTVFLTKKNAGIDLGGIAKGYTLDKIKEILSKYNVTSALINMGGNILTYKNPPNGKFWKIGIKNPRGDGISGIINVEKTKYISTSGDYERFFIKNGRRYCHILDPHTGYPAARLVSITVISDKGYLGDALSTAFFVKGKEYALSNAKVFNIELIGFDKNLKHFLTNGIKEFVTFEK
jgi:thiamine biosynthesis lipoprotein